MFRFKAVIILFLLVHTQIYAMAATRSAVGSTPRLSAVRIKAGPFSDPVLMQYPTEVASWIFHALVAQKTGIDINMLFITLPGGVRLERDSRPVFMDGAKNYLREWPLICVGRKIVVPRHQNYFKAVSVDTCLDKRTAFYKALGVNLKFSADKFG